MWTPGQNTGVPGIVTVDRHGTDSSERSWINRRQKLPIAISPDWRGRDSERLSPGFRHRAQDPRIAADRRRPRFAPKSSPAPWRTSTAVPMLSEEGADIAFSVAAALGSLLADRSAGWHARVRQSATASSRSTSPWSNAACPVVGVVHVPVTVQLHRPVGIAGHGRSVADGPGPDPVNAAAAATRSGSPAAARMPATACKASWQLGPPRRSSHGQFA